MASLPQSGTGPAATATPDPAARWRVAECSSFGSVALAFDWLLPDPRRNLHGLVSERIAAARSRTMGVSSIRPRCGETLQGIVKNAHAVHLVHSDGLGGAIPSLEPTLPNLTPAS